MYQVPVCNRRAARQTSLSLPLALKPSTAAVLLLPVAIQRSHRLTLSFDRQPASTLSLQSCISQSFSGQQRLCCHRCPPLRSRIVTRPSQPVFGRLPPGSTNKSTIRTRRIAPGGLVIPGTLWFARSGTSCQQQWMEHFPADNPQERAHQRSAEEVHRSSTMPWQARGQDTAFSRAWCTETIR